MIAQQPLFDVSQDKELTKPKHHPCYELHTVPMSLLTADEWKADGFAVNTKKVEAYVWDNESWVPLYSSATTKPTKTKIIHIPSVQGQLLNINAKITAKQAEIDKWKKHRDIAVKLKSKTSDPDEIEFFKAALSNACGRWVDCIDEVKELEKAKAKLERLQKKAQ